MAGRAGLSSPSTLTIEQRPDRSVMLTDTAGASRGVAAAGIAGGAALLAGVVAGGLTPLGGVVVLPLGLIVLLAGLGVLRHRDWILFDRAARQIAYRRGLGSIFRPVRVVSFDDVEAVAVDRVEPDGADIVVRLRCVGDVFWSVARSADAAYIARLAAAIRDAGGWPLVRDGREEAG